MSEIVIKLEIPEQFKEEFKIALARVVKEFVKRIELLELEQIRKKLESSEEQELIKWSVELGRKAKKGRFKRLLSEVSPKIKEELSE